MKASHIKRIKESVDAFMDAFYRESDRLSLAIVSILEEIYEEWEWHTDLLKKSKMKPYTWVKPATDKGTITEFSNLIKGIHLSNMTQLVIEAIKKYKKEGCLYDNSKNKDGQDRKWNRKYHRSSL